MTELAHFYHCYAAGAWEAPAAEHLQMLTRTEFNGPLTVGLVGPEGRRRLARRVFETVYPQTEFVGADGGYEEVTIRALHEYAKHHDGAVMYAHTKGSWSQGDGREHVSWRRVMTHYLIGEWRRNAAILDRGWVDALGPYWMVPGQFDPIAWRSADVCPIFGGNFWAASCAFVRGLPPIKVGTVARDEAEYWLGRGRPVVLNLLHGTPTRPWPGIPPVRLLQVEVDGELHPRLDAGLAPHVVVGRRKLKPETLRLPARPDGVRGRVWNG